MQGRKLVHLLEDVGLADEPVEQDTAGRHGVLGLGPFLGGIRASFPVFGSPVRRHARSRRQVNTELVAALQVRTSGA